jgi:carbamoyl-phosphate synthase small subunit
VVAYDFGIKTTILRHLAGFAQVEVVPASTTADEVLAREPDGVFLSNGPGDPAAVDYAVDNVRDLLGEVPMFGICLGHQLMAIAMGGQVEKLPFGHHGGNHPVRRLRDGVIEITSQNHNFAVAEATNDIEVTHRNLNDGVIEGVAAPGLRAFSVQHHPEAGPGPRDSVYLFQEFADLMGEHSGGPRIDLRSEAGPPLFVSGPPSEEPDGLIQSHLRRDAGEPIRSATDTERGLS